MASAISPYYRFTNCCTLETLDFRGTIPGFINGNVYRALINNILTRDQCYTVVQLNTQDTTFWNSLPLISNESILDIGISCEDDTCPSCDEPCGECPEGFVQVGDECILEQNVPATYTGGLVTIIGGDKITSYNKFGLRLYPDITATVKPLLGSANPYVVRENNGAGAPVVPIITGVQSTLWGCEVPPVCSTFVGPSTSYGGRLNIAGLWAPGYDIPDGDGPELFFDFCVDIAETKQYLVGIAGDNKVKFYVDGILNVFLNAGGAGGTAPFNWWHVFPVTLTAGQHTIRLSGINNSISDAAFAGEIYDIPLGTFQATLTDPAIGVGNCGNVPADLEPYIIFTTRDMIGESIPNPNQPGIWQCPDGSTPDYCTGIPQCLVEEKIPFPICPCYLLLPCDGTTLPIISNNPLLATYVNNYVAVIVEEGGEPICVYVLNYEGEEVCETAIEVKINGDVQCPCPPQCYYISGSQGTVYVNDTEGGLVELTPAETYPYIRICSNTYPLVSNDTTDYEIINLGECKGGVCPELCFSLTNCDNDQLVIYSNSNSLIPYAFGSNNIVQLVGKEGCWQVELTSENCDCLEISIVGKQINITAQANVVDQYDGYNVYSFVDNSTTYYIWYNIAGWEITIDGYGTMPYTPYARTIFDGPCPDSITYGFDWIGQTPGTSIETKKCNPICDCPVDVIVSTSYSKCEDCIGYIAYKLTACEGNDTIYTLLNLEAYIGQVVKLDCGCYKVEQIDYLPANPQTIKLEDVFTNCTQCLRTYYKLTDCAGKATDIITYSDLALYVGQTIKIENCTECWIVTSTDEHLNATTVVVIDSFTDCEACGVFLPCVCSTVTNFHDETKVYSYLDCEKNVQLVSVEPGHTSPRGCVLEWISNDACACLQAKIKYFFQDEFQETNFKFEKTNEIINGKPVYEVCLVDIPDQFTHCYKIAFYDGCWYALHTVVNTQNIGNIQLPSYKLCTTDVCPTGLWEYFPCGCFTATFTYCVFINDCITTTVEFYAAGQANGYFYYTGYYGGELVEIKFNPSLNRWELIQGGTTNVIGYSDYAGECPIPNEAGEWVSEIPLTTFAVNHLCDFDPVPRLTTELCQNRCECLHLNLAYQIGPDDIAYYDLVAISTGNIINGKWEYRAYFFGFEVTIYFDSVNNKWILFDVPNQIPFANINYDILNPDCPIGTWSIIPNNSKFISASTEYCKTDEGPLIDPFTNIQFFGECQHGVCPPPTFKNNRTVRPGYNTPNCNPDRYDEITCHFANIMYKIVLEKRYGITNCCPDDDEKWLLLKELIDLQALKDPNYICPECPCSCNSGKSYSTCNCGN
jgi:hypothetical protein